MKKYIVTFECPSCGHYMSSTLYQSIFFVLKCSICNFVYREGTKHD